MTEPPFRTSAIPTPTDHGDLASALAALEHGPSGRDCATRHRTSRPAKRAVLTLAFVALLIAGAINLVTLTPNSRESTADGSQASIVFSNAETGACLNWPPDAPDKPSFVQCRADHMFEVAKPVGMNSFGEPCQLAVREYLGTRYDPNSKFTISVLWAGDADGTRVDDRNLLCGLQLLGPGGRPIAFRGSIAELDQSKVWPVGTCLGIDTANRSTDIPVDCTAPHALEVTGAVGLTERFPTGIPAEPDQRAFIQEICTQTADAYLAPGTLTTYGLALGYEPLSPASWTAGSRQVSCSVGRPTEGGWTASVGSARSLSPADVPPPPSPLAEPPPPVYEEPLIPIGPVPAEAPPSPPPSPPPTSAKPDTSAEHVSRHDDGAKPAATCRAARTHAQRKRRPAAGRHRDPRPPPDLSAGVRAAASCSSAPGSVRASAGAAQRRYRISSLGLMPDFHPEIRRAARFAPRTLVTPTSLPLIRAATKVLLRGTRPDVEQLTLPSGVDVRLHRPPGAAGSGPALLWIHGGGYVIGTPNQDDVVLHRFAKVLGITVAAVKYRLAPEHPYPAGLEDCYAALTWLAGLPAVEPGRVAIGGASAGGGLAAALAQLAKDRGEVDVAAQLLVYPMLDDRSATTPGLDDPAHRMWTQKSNRYGWSSYLGGADPSTAVPARREDLSGLPPAWIGVGTLDLFHDEDVRYAERLRGAGVPCDLEIVPGVFHGFDGVIPKSDLVKAFFASQVEFLRRTLVAESASA